MVCGFGWFSSCVFSLLLIICLPVTAFLSITLNNNIITFLRFIYNWWCFLLYVHRFPSLGHIGPSLFVARNGRIVLHVVFHSSSLSFFLCLCVLLLAVLPCVVTFYIPKGFLAS